MSDSLVSCFLPVYNAERFLEHWWQKNGPELKSVGARLIVVDNGSQDGTLRAIEEFEGLEIKLIRHSSNLGLEQSFKTAKSVIGTKYRILLPADDWLAPGYLEQALKLFESNADISVVYGRSYTVNLLNNNVSERYRPPRREGKYTESPFCPLMFNNYIPDISLFRSSDLDCNVESSNWFAAGNQATIVKRGGVYYTNNPQCFSGKREDQVSKQWERSGRYYEYFQEMYSGFGGDNSLTIEERAFLYLVHNNFHSGISLLAGLECSVKNGHPYVKSGLEGNAQGILLRICLALVDELLVDPLRLTFRPDGRLGSVQDLKTAMGLLNVSAKLDFKEGLSLRGCDGLLK